MAHLKRDKDALLRRIRRLKGQLAAVEKAIEEGGECDRVLQQLAAVRGAANGLMAQVLEGHLREHLTPNAGTDLDTLVAVIQRYLR
jgi:DNA-binding FrmR family transcriptional regulator